MLAITATATDQGLALIHILFTMSIGAYISISNSFHSTQCGWLASATICYIIIYIVNNEIMQTNMTSTVKLKAL